MKKKSQTFSITIHSTKILMEKGHNENVANMYGGKTYINAIQIEDGMYTGAYEVEDSDGGLIFEQYEIESITPMNQE